MSAHSKAQVVNASMSGMLAAKTSVDDRARNSRVWETRELLFAEHRDG